MQKNILFGICDDKTNDKIAKDLNLSVRTIEHYIEVMKRLFKIKTRGGLAIFAVKQGIYIVHLSKEKLL